MIGRVDGSKELLGRIGEPVAYAAPTEPRNAGSDGIDYLNTPNLAGTGSPISGEQPLAATSTREEPIVPASETAAAPDGSYDIPSDGVNMDAELGVANGDQGPLLIPESPQIAPGDMAIAEGATDQPVVDGIGTDNPSPYLSAPIAEDQPEPAYTGSLGKR